jgi:hypothetical protein
MQFTKEYRPPLQHFSMLLPNTKNKKGGSPKKAAAYPFSKNSSG